MFDITEGANTLTRRSSIWFTVTALLIHCSPIKCRLISRKFTAFMSSRIATKGRNAIKAHNDGFIRHRRVWFRSKHLKWPVWRFRPYLATWSFSCSIRSRRGCNVAAERDYFSGFPSRPQDAICSPLMWQTSTSSRTSDNDPEQKWDDSGGTDWWWNHSVRRVLKMKLWLMDAIVFATAQS